VAGITKKIGRALLGIGITGVFVSFNAFIFTWCLVCHTNSDYYYVDKKALKMKHEEEHKHNHGHNQNQNQYQQPLNNPISDTNRSVQMSFNINARRNY
jgi:hypothetical protein